MNDIQKLAGADGGPARKFTRCQVVKLQVEQLKCCEGQGYYVVMNDEVQSRPVIVRGRKLDRANLLYDRL